MTQSIDDILNVINQNPDLSRKLYEILRDRFASREEFQRLLEEIQISRQEANVRFEAMDKRFEAMDKRFEAMDKRFEAMDKRFEEQRLDFNKRFEAIDRRFEEQRLDFNKRFEEQRLDFNKRFDRIESTLTQMKAGLGINFEGYNKNILARFLRETRGIPSEKIIWRAHIADPQGEINSRTKQVEVDIFIQHPLIVVEVSSYIDSLDKVEKFIQVVKWLERKYQEKATAYFLTYAFAEEVEEKAWNLLQAAGIDIIITAT